MSFADDCHVLSLIKNQDNEEAKSVIKNENLYNAVDSQKNTLLHYAAEYQNPEVVQFLIDLGSEVDAKNDLGETPLIKSMKTNLPCVKVIEILLEAGAGVEMQDCTHKSALDIVDSREWLAGDTRRFEILKVFIERSDNWVFNVLLPDATKDFIEALLKTNVNLNKPIEEGETLVHFLAKNPQPGVIEQLRGRNYDVNARDAKGWTPLMSAALWNIAESTKFLLEEGADVEATGDSDKRTALYISIIMGESYHEIKQNAQILLLHGANAQIVTAGGKTIFDTFPSYEEYEVPELILAHLALQEACGTAITDLIRRKINAEQRFEVYLKDCQQELSIEIHPSVTLLDLLTAGQRKMERYFCNEELASKLADFKTKIDYFDTILSQSFGKASRMVELRKTAVPIVCKLMKMDYDRFPSIVDEIVCYLGEQDIEHLISIDNEL